MSLYDHAKRELLHAGYDLDGFKDDPDSWIAESVLELITTLSNQGHSGSSIGVALSLFNTLANYEPLGPLNGEDSEWNLIPANMSPGSSQLEQNSRCSRVFRSTTVDGTVRTYDVEGIVFEEPNGRRYHSAESLVDVTFPYVPTTKIVYREARAA